jgi:polysaccharide pyruvyl transferase WcaK-like protein
VVIRSKIQGFIDDRREQLHAEKLREIIRRYVEKTGEDVLICPEVVLEIEPARKLIYNPLSDKLKANVRFMDEFWLPEQACSVLARARAHVSMDMHSVIMALAAGTPCVHPRFVEAGIKAWMLRDLGIREWLFDIDKDPVESIAGAVEAIHADYSGALAKVKAVDALVQKRQRETMAVVRRTLDKSRGA